LHYGKEATQPVEGIVSMIALMMIQAEEKQMTLPTRFHALLRAV